MDLKVEVVDSKLDKAHNHICSALSVSYSSELYRVLTHYDSANNKPGIFSFPSIRTLRPDVSPAFEQIVMKAFALAPEQRWNSAAGMEMAIEKVEVTFIS
jgi:hypothetical protein